MPFPNIDVIIWNDSERHMIMASAVSPKGMRFLDSLTGEKANGMIELACSPQEFERHVPVGVTVVFLKDDNTFVRITTTQGLQ